jgi:hypothetical protein
MRYVWGLLIVAALVVGGQFNTALADPQPTAVSTEGLNANDQKMVEDLVKKLKDGNKPPVVEKVVEQAQNLTPDQVAEYAKVGQAYGTALAETAKSLGVAADEILSSQAGQIAMVIIVWKMIGRDLMEYVVGIGGGLIWFGVMLPGWVWSIRKFVLNVPGKINEKFKDGVVIERTVDAVEWDSGRGALYAVHLAALVLICISGFVMVFA